MDKYYSKQAEKVLYRFIGAEFGADASDVWNSTLQKYAAFTEVAPDYGGKKSPHVTQIYSAMLLLAFCESAPKDYSVEDLEPLSFEMIMAAFRMLGRVFNANHGWTMNLMAKIFEKSVSDDNRHAVKYPADFSGAIEPYDRQNHIVRYRFTNCPIAEFVKENGLGKWMPLMCNCDHTGLAQIHAGLIREGTCYTGNCCDYLVLGDRNPLCGEYDLIRNPDGLLISVKK